MRKRRGVAHDKSIDAHDKSIDYGFLEDDKIEEGHYFGASKNVEYIDGRTAGIEPNVSRIYFREEHDEEREKLWSDLTEEQAEAHWPEMGTRKEPLPENALESSLLATCADRLCIRDVRQDNLNHEIILFLIDRYGMENDALCDSLYDEIRYQRGIKIGFSTLMDRAGTQTLDFRDGQAILEWGFLQVTTAWESNLFMARPTYPGRMRYTKRILRKRQLVTLKKMSSKTKHVLVRDFLQRITA